MFGLAIFFQILATDVSLFHCLNSYFVSHIEFRAQGTNSLMNIHASKKGREARGSYFM